MSSSNTSSSRVSEQFWDSVSQFYGTHQLTNHKSDFELDCVNNLVKHMGQIDNLICLGVADGSRDPLVILGSMTDLEMPLPKEMHFNDLSGDLLAQCKKKVVTNHPGVVATYHSLPMEELPDKIGIKFPNPDIIIGLYDADYFIPSLNGYLESKDVIGTDFMVGYTVFKDGKISHGSWQVHFDIDNYSIFAPDFVKMRSDKNFLAYSIMTEKNFISHYWDKQMLEELMKLVFEKDMKNVTNVGDRYLVTHIQSKSEHISSNTLITSLNNVVGNIPFEHQLESLQAIKTLY